MNCQQPIPYIVRDTQKPRLTVALTDAASKRGKSLIESAFSLCLSLLMTVVLTVPCHPHLSAIVSKLSADTSERGLPSLRLSRHEGRKTGTRTDRRHSSKRPFWQDLLAMSQAVVVDSTGLAAFSVCWFTPGVRVG